MERRRSSVSSATSEKRSNATIISISASAGETEVELEQVESPAPIVSPEVELSTADSVAALPTTGKRFFLLLFRFYCSILVNTVYDNK